MSVVEKRQDLSPQGKIELEPVVAPKGNVPLIFPRVFMEQGVFKQVHKPWYHSGSKKVV